MSTRRSHPPDLGPDLLARYLNVYMQSRQMSDAERPWGLGDDGLDELWTRLTTALNDDPKRLNAIITAELSEIERARIIETLAPLLFAIPLRTYPAKLESFIDGERFVFVLSHADEDLEPVGHLPAALAGSFTGFLRRVLSFAKNQKSKESVISSGGRRRLVLVTLSPNEATIRFLERMPSPATER